MPLKSTQFVITACFAICAVGCGPVNRVEEVTVDESGVAVDAAAAGALQPNDWPAWRGPDNNGIAAPQDLVTQWDEQTHIRWRTLVPGRGHSSPIVVGDSIYLATAFDDRQQQMVMAFDHYTGSPQWTKVIHRGGFPADRDLHRKSTNANGTLASDGQRLYIAFLNAEKIVATALDLQGEILWQQEVGKFVCRFGYAPSPIVYGSLVIVAADNRGGGYLAALDGATGDVAWRVARGALDNYSSPVVAHVGGRDQLLISGCDAVTSYDPATGKQNWSTHCVAQSTCGTIVTTEDRIFAAGGYPERETACLSPEGQIVWTNNTKIYEPSMIVDGDHVVAVNDDGVAYCWQIDNGNELWRKRLGGNFSASPIRCGQDIYVSNLQGKTFVFRAREEYQPIAVNHLGDDCYASPAVSDGELFLRVGYGEGTDRAEQLVCIAAEAEL